MSYYGQVFEDPEYYDERPYDPEQPYEDGDDEWEDIIDSHSWVDLVDNAEYQPF